MLQSKYELFALHPQYITTATIENESEHVEYGTLLTVDEKDEKVNSMGDDDMVEVVMVSDEYAMKLDDEESAEEYEILEVEQSEFNGTVEAEHSDVKNIQIIEKSDQFIADSDAVQDNVEGKRAKKTKPTVDGVRRSLRGSARFKSMNDQDSKNKNVRRPGKSSTRANDAKKERRQKSAEIHLSDVEHCVEEADEGESGDEFPARDSDNDDWPAQQTISEFPKEILRDGLLLIKGKQLMSMICK